MVCAMEDAAYRARRYSGYVRRHGSSRVLGLYAISRDSMTANAVCALLFPNEHISVTVINFMMLISTSPAFLLNGPRLQHDILHYW